MLNAFTFPAHGIPRASPVDQRWRRRHVTQELVAAVAFDISQIVRHEPGRLFDRDLERVSRELDCKQAAGPVATMWLGRRKGDGWRPHESHSVRYSFAMLVQVPADDELDIAVSQPGQQSNTSCRHHAGGGGAILARMLNKQGLVEEKRDRPSPGCSELVIQPAALLEFTLKLRSKELGVEADQNPVSGFPDPTVNPE